MGVVDDLLDVPSQKRQIQDQRQPITIDEEQESEETVDSSFGNNVRVETVAKLDRVDIVANSACQYA